MISRRNTTPDPEADTPCPVCRAAGTAPFSPGYRLCPCCEAVFLLPDLFLSPGEERQRYLLHRNDPGDAGYRDFLSRLARPLLERLAPGRTGLDYGSGPGPALARILEEAGHRVNLFDPFFHPDPGALAGKYDFIACSETAEHFHDPYSEFARLDQMLKPGGLLGIMTAFRPPGPGFEDWHYRRDPTHVVFYRETTFRHISSRFGWSCEFPAPDIFIGRKVGDSNQ